MRKGTANARCAPVDASRANHRRCWGRRTICSKLHAKLKVQRFQQLSQSSVCARKSARRQFMGISVSKPPFKIVLKGKGDLERALACDFGQIVR
jgi:hypothetical protein